MEPQPAAATSFPVAQDPPPRPALQTAKLGQGPAQRGRGRWAFLVTMSVVVTGSGAWAVYQARHSRRDLAFVIVTYYLITLLCCCLEKLNLLRRDDPAAAPESRRIRIVVWVFSVLLAVTFAARASFAVTELGLKIAVWVVTGLGIGLSLYFFFARADSGRQTDEEPLPMVSPEQRV